MKTQWNRVKWGIMLGLGVLPLAVGSVGPAFAQQKPIVIRFAHVDPADLWISKKQAMAIAFKLTVEARSVGRISVEVYPAGQLGGEREAIEAVKLGNLEMTSTADGPISGFVPEVLVLGIPYLFSSGPVAWKVMDGPFGAELGEEIRKKTGIRILAYGETGFRNFTNSTRPVRNPDDMKGLKIRTMENPAHVAMVKALGANPTPIPWPEVYTSLQTKVVDGQENPVATIIQAKLNEVQKYLTLDGHLYGPDFIYINDKFFLSLPPDLRNIVKEAAVVGGTAGRAIQQLNSLMGVETLRKAGMEIYAPSPAELQAFRKATQAPVIKFVEEKAGKGWVEKVQKAAAEAEASLAVTK